MKKKLRVMGFIIASALTFTGTNAFSFTEPGGGGSTWKTSSCSKTNSDGTTSYGSGCDTPATDGPCDKKKDCGYTTKPE